jgi:HD superfamily phosphohydrolase
LPQWGLTEELRRERPWRIPQEWLEPGKVITDPIHGDVYVNRLEQAIIDSTPFQRLRRIRQLGTVHLVYPGATHTRFSHALGALRTAQDLFDIVLGQREGRHGTLDLFTQWRQDGDNYDLRVAKAMVLARLGALLHDICHVAYGHSVEDDLRILIPHDANVERFEVFWEQLGDNHPKYDAIQKLLQRPQLKRNLRPLILSKERKNAKNPKSERLPPPEERIEFPFVADMVGNTICADLLDYLQRDHLFTGLPAALGHRFMTAFFVTPDNEQDEDISPEQHPERSHDAVHYPRRMALHIHRGEGRERTDIVSELLKHLRFRYELQERVIVHHAKLAADAMLGKMLALWFESQWVVEAADKAGPQTEAAIGRDLDYDDIRDAVREDHGDGAPEELDRDIRSDIEAKFRLVSDDGLVEFLAAQFTTAEDERGKAVHQLARDLLARRLYKREGHCGGVAEHERLYKLFGDAERRRWLERDAARFAEIKDEQVAIWLPEPRMRLKFAEVFVDYGAGIAPFNEYSNRGADIYEAHRKLWSVSVYVHPQARERARIVLARLAETMGVVWHEWEDQLGPDPQLWPRNLAAQELAGGPGFRAEVAELLKEVESRAFRGQDTFEATKLDLDAVAKRRRKR